MDPKKIKGTYILRAGLDDIVNGYTFTNNDRQVSLTANDAFMLNFTCEDIHRPVNTDVSFISNNKLFIKRARVLTVGAPGLQGAANSAVAAGFNVIAKATNSTSADNVGAFTFSLDFYNEWQELNIEFLPTRVNDNYYFSLDGVYTSLTLDDYNLQSAYEGETFKAVLELEIDTAGLFDHNGEVV